MIDMFLMNLLAFNVTEIFGGLIVLGFWISLAYLVITRSSLQRNIAGSPSALDGRGQFIRKS